MILKGEDAASRLVDAVLVDGEALISEAGHFVAQCDPETGWAVCHHYPGPHAPTTAPSLHCHQGVLRLRVAPERRADLLALRPDLEPYLA